MQAVKQLRQRELWFELQLRRQQAGPPGRFFKATQYRWNQHEAIVALDGAAKGQDRKVSPKKCGWF